MQEFSQLQDCPAPGISYDDISQPPLGPRPQTERGCLARKRGHREIDLRCFPEDKGGNAVALITEYEVRSGFLVEVGHPSSYQCERRPLQFGQVESEWDSPLKPRFHGMSISRDDFNWICTGQICHMEIGKLGESLRFLPPIRGYK
jgi:hypothetical protein